MAAFRHPRLVRCQVAGDNVWTGVHHGPGWSPDWTEVLAATEVDGWVDLLSLDKVGVSSCGVIDVRWAATGVATIAIADGVDKVAT
jgi:hypothetical protein